MNDQATRLMRSIRDSVHEQMLRETGQEVAISTVPIFDHQRTLEDEPRFLGFILRVVGQGNPTPTTHQVYEYDIFIRDLTILPRRTQQDEVRDHTPHGFVAPPLTDAER